MCVCWCGCAWGRGEREEGPEVHRDPECISNPSGSLISLSGDIITITASIPQGSRQGPYPGAGTTHGERERGREGTGEGEREM